MSSTKFKEKIKNWYDRDKTALFFVLIIMALLFGTIERFSRYFEFLFLLNGILLGIFDLCKGEFCSDTSPILFILLIAIESFFVGKGITWLVRKMKKKKLQNFSKDPNLQIENAIRLMVKYFPKSLANSRKPILFHDIRVGIYLYENGYSSDIVLAGLLHDMIEWSDVSKQILKDEFGENVVRLILANTKDDTIKDTYKERKTEELISRCVENGQDALIVKSADILDSFKWYTAQNNQEQLKYCRRNADAIFKFKPDDFCDKIFDELKKYIN